MTARPHRGEEGRLCRAGDVREPPRYSLPRPAAESGILTERDPAKGDGEEVL